MINRKLFHFFPNRLKTKSKILNHLYLFCFSTQKGTYSVQLLWKSVFYFKFRDPSQTEEMKELVCVQDSFISQSRMGNSVWGL